jgi:formate C-acetyltransferase
MATLQTTATRQHLWNTFSADREALYNQYLDVPYDPATGQSPEALRRAVERYLEAHASEPPVLQKAHLFRYLLAESQIHVDPRDWYPDKFNHGGALNLARQRWHEVARQAALADDVAWTRTLSACGLGRGGGLDLGHISAGWERLFADGLSGLMAEAAAARARFDDPARRAFLEAVEIVYSAAIALSERFAAQAESLASAQPEYRERMEIVAAACRRVPAHAPRTLHEALYFAWLMHELIEFEGEAVRSLGRLDVALLPYYRADVAAGRLTRAQAIELFQYYFVKSYARTRGTENGAHFCLGGQLPDGSDAANELTALILEAREGLGAPDPKLSVRFFAGSPEGLYRDVLEMIRRGQNAVVLINDEAVVPALVARGKAPEDARRYIPIGCYEPAVDGMEAACTTNLVINLAKGLELALHDGADPLTGRQVGPRTGDPRTFTTFVALRDAYWAQMQAVIDRSAASMLAHEVHWSAINPSPLLAGTIQGCIETGRDIGDGGCFYNATGCVGAGLANAADGLLALKRAVYDEGRYTLDEVIAALDRDYQGDEALRAYLQNAVDKWGNGRAEADALGVWVAERYCQAIHAHRNARGGPYQAALYSFTFQWDLGAATGATPDGRHAHAPLAPGVGAMAGRDRAGVTALLESVTKLDFTQTPNGSVLDVRLHPSSVRGEAGLAAMVALVRTFFARGGFALQFNIVDSATLLAAQRQPEAHATLQVRVAGYSAYFVNLTREMQDHLIAQVSHTL